MREVDLHGLGHLILREKLAHRILEAPADRASDRLKGWRRPPETWQRVHVAAVNRREGINERAIQIKEQGPKARHGLSRVAEAERPTQCRRLKNEVARRT